MKVMTPHKKRKTGVTPLGPRQMKKLLEKLREEVVNSKLKTKIEIEPNEFGGLRIFSNESESFGAIACLWDHFHKIGLCGNNRPFISASAFYRQGSSSASKCDAKIWYSKLFGTKFLDIENAVKYGDLMFDD
jgi:hypothetical protein